MVFHKLDGTIEFQEKIINYLKGMKGIVVKESIDEITKWKRINNYKKTRIISQE